MDSPKDEEKLDLPEEEPKAPKVLRRIGIMKGQFKIPDDFDTMMAEEIEEMFYGNPDKFSDSRDDDSSAGESKAQP
jgi:hypothetical protein